MSKNHLLIEIYRDDMLQWRWRMKRSGRVLADSGEGYTRKAKCLQTLNNLMAAFVAGTFEITDVPEKSGS